MRNHRMMWRFLFLNSVICTIAAAQSMPPKKEIPAIAKAAKGAIVTIVMANDDKPIARGTGFLVSPEGEIVTNYHVIETGNVAVVKFADGTVLPVDGVLATDEFHDLAILKIHGKTFQTLTLGNSDQSQVGEEVVAIGNPLGLELTVSNGIISGIRTDEKQESKLLQITAPISRGSSGGPLFNMSGEVVGINALFIEGGESLNFAIPVNDAKNVLQNQSAQLQQLPNESEADSEPNPPRPDAATKSPSDAPSPEEKESGIGPSSHNTGKEKQTPSYYIRSYQHGSFIIEYDGRRMIATCREALSWPDDDLAELGRPTREHECMYINHKVGKHIAAEQMWRRDKQLYFEPFGDKVHVADVLNIVADAPIGSPLRRPSPKTSAEISNTLRWIQNTLADEDGNTLHNTKDGKERWINLLPDVNGCQVTFVESTTAHSKEIGRKIRQVDLGDLDPTSLELHASEHDAFGEAMSLVSVDTTDKVPAVRLDISDRSWEPSMEPVPSAGLHWYLPAPYDARFAKALKHAITLCGGKPSSF